MARYDDRPGGKAAKADGCRCDSALNKLGLGRLGADGRYWLVSGRCPLHASDQVYETQLALDQLAREG